MDPKGVPDTKTNWTTDVGRKFNIDLASLVRQLETS
jgi:hypothetical protein